VGQWVLYDGDKIACLLAQFFAMELEAAGLTTPGSLSLETHFTKVDSQDDSGIVVAPDTGMKIGVVQTAYANGSSTKYIKALGIPVFFTKTGVKYLHRAAHMYFDCGIYFEANGHGTVLFSDRLREAIEGWDEKKHGQEVAPRMLVAYKRLKACLLLINQVTGDSISDMLLVLAVLHILKMDIHQWSAMYTDLPSKQVKVVVKDKSAITCSDDEMEVVTPKELQNRLNASMAAVSEGRCFVRPSGTEDVVRIYAEASNLEGVEQLVRDATIAIQEILA